jgi:hypothetical protein
VADDDGLASSGVALPSTYTSHRNDWRSSALCASSIINHQSSIITTGRRSNCCATMADRRIGVTIDGITWNPTVVWHASLYGIVEAQVQHAPRLAPLAGVGLDDWRS